MIPRAPNVIVLGAGTMGAQLGCLLAGAGSRVRLLDLDDATAAAGLDRVSRLRPSPLYVAADRARITTGSFDQLDSLAAADWVLEAVVEQLEPKRALFERVDRALAALDPSAPGPLVSSNTSGIPIAALAEGRSDRFRAAFLGTAREASADSYVDGMKDFAPTIERWVRKPSAITVSAMFSVVTPIGTSATYGTTPSPSADSAGFPSS